MTAIETAAMTVILNFDPILIINLEPWGFGVLRESRFKKPGLDIFDGRLDCWFVDRRGFDPPLSRLMRPVHLCDDGVGLNRLACFGVTHT